MDEESDESTEEEVTCAEKGESEIENRYMRYDPVGEKQGVDSGDKDREDRSVIRDENDEGERARVTRDEERVPAMRLNRDEVMQTRRLSGRKNFVRK